LLKTIGSVAIVALVSALLLELSRGRTINVATSISKGTVDSPLGLKLERSGTDWRVSWNRNADVLLQALGGHLSITDGSLRKELDLDPSELRSGSVMYAPLTGDVLVRLQVVGGSLSQPVSESVRVIAGNGTPSQTSASRSPSNESTDLKIQPPSADAPMLAGKKSANAPPSETSASVTQLHSGEVPLKLESPKVRVNSDKIEASPDSLSQTPGVKPALAEPAVSPPVASALPPSTLPESMPNLASVSPPPSPPSRNTAPVAAKSTHPNSFFGGSQSTLRRHPDSASQGK
jgi:hypothetical protein